MREKLTLETFAKVRDGMFALMVEKALEHALRDVEAAPELDADRVIPIELKLRPETDAGGLSDVSIAFVVKSPRLPARQVTLRSTPATDWETGSGRRALFFERDSPEDPHQPTLFGDQEPDDEHEEDGPSQPR